MALAGLHVVAKLTKSDDQPNQNLVNPDRESRNRIPSGRLESYLLDTLLVGGRVLDEYLKFGIELDLDQ